MRPHPAAVACSALAILTTVPACVVVVDNGEHVTSYDHRRDTPRIGVELADVSSSTAAQAGVESSRTCIITAVSFGSAAERAGLQQYDIVTRIDGRDYATVSALREAIRARHAGETLNLTVIRAGKPQDVTVTVGES